MRLDDVYTYLTTFNISIHAPLARCDYWGWQGRARCHYFNPRTSCEVRPETLLRRFITLRFQSTHLLRGATSDRGGCGSQTGHFNPRTSCEVRPSVSCIRACCPFQSTHLLRGATAFAMCNLLPQLFQSTHLLRGATRYQRFWKIFVKFQSTHLLRGATATPAPADNQQQFQSTHLLRGATYRRFTKIMFIIISIHAPLARCDNIKLV